MRDEHWGVVVRDKDGRPVFSSPSMTQGEAQGLKDRLNDMNAQVVSHEEAVAASREMVNRIR